ncbi:hypothetical protein ACHAXR_007295 [Thalassiosira sp. AJA248-18]
MSSSNPSNSIQPIDSDGGPIHKRVASATALAMDDISPAAVPTLKVMRLQAPQLGQPSAGSLLSSNHLLSSTILLPDSFGVIHVGETFSAYLGVLNASVGMSVRGLTVSSQLQTPSRRIVLPSRLDNTPCDIDPSGGVDAIVSRRLEEVGPHILRVEVGYISMGSKSLRKFYRFNVTMPLNITETVTRSGDADCLVSITVENAMEKQGAGGGAVTISSVGFEATNGLVAEQITLEEKHHDERGGVSAVELYDSCGRLESGECHQYLFSVKAESEAAALRGIACGDDLGQAVLTYQKAMGEMGKVYSAVVVCPPTSYMSQAGSSDNVANSKFVVHRSGLSVDVAAASAQRSMSGQRNNEGSLDERLPVTVEPIDPPSTMKLSVPKTVSLLIVNHSSQTMNLQLQMRLSDMTGVVVCGPSFISLGGVPPSGGSCTTDVRLVALVAGLFSVQGCYIVDLSSGMELCQSNLFDVFIELPHDGIEEKKADKGDAFLKLPQLMKRLNSNDHADKLEKLMKRLQLCRLALEMDHQRKNLKFSFKDCMLAWDTGASFGLSPFRADFIDYVECHIPVKDVSKANYVVGIGTTLHLHKFMVNGEAFWLP